MKVWVLSHGHRCTPHRFGATSLDSNYVMGVFESEEKVIDHIRRNNGPRIAILSARDSFDEYFTIEEFREAEKLVYARTSNDSYTEYQYYMYHAYDMQ